MARLRSTGYALLTPFRDRACLDQALVELGVRKSFDDEAIQDLYRGLASVAGSWSQEQHAPDDAPLVAALLTSAKELDRVSYLLSGLEDGFHTDLEIQFSFRVAELLTLDPSVGSRPSADDIISAFRKEAARIAHVCFVAHADLSSQHGEKGRVALQWYDDFVILLLGVAKRANVEPRMQKDRITGGRSGWLIDAAQALETFFYPQMRSQSLEACGKRIERSLKRLSERKRQKPVKRRPFLSM